MTEEIKDGGQAFPQPIAVSPMGDYCPAYPGMTLRDYFAAKALAALISHEGKDYENRGKKAVPILAKFAYEYADTMLAAREAK